MNQHPIPSRPLLMIAGPTAVGKSAVALELAQRLGGEIISVDSMQVYSGMDLGTAKPSPAERAQVPHHLIDVVPLRESFDASRFVQRAGAAVRDIQGRGRIPILCGGTGLYFQAFLEGLGEAPPSDTTIRAELERAPLPELLEELNRADPESFRTIDRKNRRRVVRALEVIRLSGRPFSEQRAHWLRDAQTHPEPGRGNPFFFGLEREANDLHSRIDQRVEAMFEQGLVREVEQLLGQGLAENRTAMQALGYRQVMDHLRGAMSLPETISLVKQKTRKYAKRQMTWFRRQAMIQWIQLPKAGWLESAVDPIQLRIGRA